MNSLLCFNVWTSCIPRAGRSVEFQEEKAWYDIVRAYESLFFCTNHELIRFQADQKITEKERQKIELMTNNTDNHVKSQGFWSNQWSLWGMEIQRDSLYIRHIISPGKSHQDQVEVSDGNCFVVPRTHGLTWQRSFGFSKEDWDGESQKSSLFTLFIFLWLLPIRSSQVSSDGDWICGSTDTSRNNCLDFDW
jgi:hypothetical protein